MIYRCHKPHRARACFPEQCQDSRVDVGVGLRAMLGPSVMGAVELRPLGDSDCRLIVPKYEFEACWILETSPAPQAENDCASQPSRVGRGHYKE
jgi:hypothetical protein